VHVWLCVLVGVLGVCVEVCGCACGFVGSNQTVIVRRVKLWYDECVCVCVDSNQTVLVSYVTIMFDPCKPNS
jgi:hypothetical protein